VTGVGQTRNTVRIFGEKHPLGRARRRQAYKRKRIFGRYVLRMETGWMNSQSCRMADFDTSGVAILLPKC
jgi:hypothetical protein